MTTTVLGQELPALIADGYTSFKLYMTYDPLKLNGQSAGAEGPRSGFCRQ